MPSSLLLSVVQTGIFIILWLPHAFAGNGDDMDSRKLKKNYPQASYAALKHVSGYTFSYDKRINNLVVSNTEQTEIINLKGNTTEVFTWFYDDNSSLETTIFADKKGKKLYTEKLCGNYEVNDIFYSDAKVCAHRLALTNIGEIVSIDVKKIYTDSRYLTRVFFHEDYPALEREIYFSVPKGVDVQFKEINCEGYPLEKTVTPEKDGATDIYRFVLKAIPAFKKEENTTGHIRTYPHLLILTKGYTYTGQTHDRIIFG